ncbi:MAG TPA: YebC/PmpR family DNA-binding transcriptional regulator [Patescibacteria group bacterium]|nr:YebC/PmpR family DNA-binding transcriptional regulator [Patescibacteria group bacterium]
MSRHSKWSKVKQFKGAIDAKRSASFTKLARVITVAAREKGGDPNMNASLRSAVQKAREASMPKDAIERAITRGTGEGAEGQIESLVYEAYAPGGTALVIECLTDSRNRTSNDVKHLLSKNGGTLAAAGSVTYLFDHLGVVRIPGGLPADRREEVELSLIDAGASNIVDLEDSTEIQCAPQDLTKVANMVTQLGLKIDSAEMEWIPKTTIETDEASGMKAAELIESLEEHDDVQHVFSNLA